MCTSPHVTHSPVGTAERQPTDWVRRFAGLVPAGGSVLDLACGGGRHARFFLDRGHPVLALDRDTDGLGALQTRRGPERPRATPPTRAPRPPPGPRLAALVGVSNSVYRTRFPHLLTGLEEGGVLRYQTCALGHARHGRPRNPKFLLAPGELLQLVGGALCVVAFEQGLLGETRQAVVQRICAVRKPPGQAVDDLSLYPHRP